MKFNRLPLSLRWLGVLLVVSLLSIACTRGDQIANQSSLPSLMTETNTLNPDDRSQYHYLYVVYCNGTVERLDLVQREKVGCFQLAERSGNPSAVAVLPLPGPGARTGVCLARPVITEDTQDQVAGVVHIVASSDVDIDDNGYADFSLLTFTLPDWTLQHARDLGNFYVLNDVEPRMLRAPDGALTLQPRKSRNSDGTYTYPPGSNPWRAMFNLIQTYTGKEHLNWDGTNRTTQIFEWSADTVLFRYELPGEAGSDLGGFGFALADHKRRHIIPLDEFLEEDVPIPPDAHLAPGGQFVLMVMSRVVPLGGGIEQVENSGELRLYDAEGHLVSTLMEPGIEGEKLAQVGRVAHDELVMSSANIWRLIALTPNGLAVFTNLRGDYRFIELGQTFGVEPVVNPLTGDFHGTYPGLVYARE